MEFLYILTLQPHYHTLTNWTEQTNETMGLHFAYLKKKFEDGVMKHVGRTDLDFGDDDLHGYAVFEAENREAALKIMNEDPAVSGGLMSARLLPYKIVFS
jgi:uncharacterized protein YciI